MLKAHFENMASTPETPKSTYTPRNYEQYKQKSQTTGSPRYNNFAGFQNSHNFAGSNQSTPKNKDRV